MDLFGSLAGLVGQEAEDSEGEEEVLDEGDEEGQEEAEEGAEEGAPRSAATDAPKLSFWGVASALTASVKAKTAEVLTAVQETDWRAELEAFQQGAKEDAAAVGKGADVVVHKAREAAEHLPTKLEQLHLPASLHLPDPAAALQARAGAASAVAREKAEKGLASLGALGSKLVLGTHDLFEQISHAVQNELALTEQHAAGGQRGQSGAAGIGSQQRYSRFDADVAAMQRDSSTYCDEPEDVEEFEAWLASFDLADRKPDIDHLIAENTFMAELQARIVPLIVEYDAFWTRYFYRLHRLELKHAQFQQLTQGTLAVQEEEVGWGSDEDEEQALAAASPVSTAPSLAAAAAPAAVPQAAPTSASAAQPEAGQEAVQLTPAACPAEEAQPEALQEGVQAEEAAPTAGEHPSAAAQEAASSIAPAAAAPAQASPAATVSSDTSVASGEHWQVVSSPKPAAGKEQLQAEPAQPEKPEQGQEEQQPNDVQPQQQQQQSQQVAAAAGAKAKAAADKPAAAAAAGGAATALAASDAGGAAGAADDEQLSDWGDEDEAALDAVAAGAGAEDAAGGDSDWGSDWE
ncbi:BSD domain-containing 1 [Chlorella sorokiniana]|uniref:BSD domain-containing 1 n=1 Tax=Chlorella sorokiniana TaxID=3076 RepID=A0A2P6U3N3_CHLSO|nr:BSD domain-containing 1 [Chlorella sorokiniana]|eukprot:PRW60920.1 BSD domain-containing 1 [Chlorella sorokiniana]